MSLTARLNPVPEGLCVVTQIADKRTGDLREYLRELPRGLNSPLARVDGTHFARWQVIRFEGKDGRPASGVPPHLMFASEHDGPADRYVERLCESLGPVAHGVWAHCAGYPGDAPGVLARYLLDHRVRAGYSVVAYPDATLKDVRDSLGLRDRLDAFVIRARGLEPQALKDAWDAGFSRRGR